MQNELIVMASWTVEGLKGFLDGRDAAESIGRRTVEPMYLPDTATNHNLNRSNNCRSERSFLNPQLIGPAKPGLGQLCISLTYWAVGRVWFGAPQLNLLSSRAPSTLLP